MDKKIATVKENELEFVWVSSHYDIHLNGICKYKGELCEFKGIQPNWNPEKDDWYDTFYEIYKLSFKEKLNWVIRQKKFEIAVGYHWSYPQRKKNVEFKIRKPKWLFNMLFRMYYKSASNA